MTYAANLAEENINSQYLLVMVPRRYLTDYVWTLVGGTIYKTSFDFGQIVSVTSDDTALVEAPTSSVGSGEFFYDVDTEEIYLDVGADPATKDIVAGYEIYCGTFDAHFNRDPLDSATRTVYFEPLISKSPAIVANTGDSLFGYLPASSTQIVLSNVTAFFTRHVYDSSFNNAVFNLYHYLGELETANVKLVYRGLINSVSYQDKEIAIKVLDRTYIFDKEYRHASDRNFFDPTTFPDINDNSRNRPIRKVFGFLEGVLGINYAFSETISAATNDKFCLHSGTANPGKVTKTAGMGSTPTRTYLNSVTGLRVGDNLWIDSGAGPAFDEYPVITAIGANYVDHAAITNPALNGDSVIRSFLGAVFVIMDSVSYRLAGTEWSEIIDGSKGILGVQINQASLVTTPRMVGPSDVIYCRFYGEKNTAMLGGNPFGADSDETGTLTQGIVLLWQMFKNLGLYEAELDAAAFTTLQAIVPDQFGYQIPFKTGDDFPVTRDVVTQFAKSLLLKVFLNDENLWSIRQSGPMGAVDKTIEDDEILDARFAYQFDYQEILSDVFVDFAPSEINSRSQLAGDLAYQKVHAVSSVASRLHGVTKQKTFDSWHFLESEAQTLADRLRFYFGDRRGLITIATKNRFFDTEINDVITISRPRMPGYEFSEDTNRSRDFAAQASQKGLYEIEIQLDDQKGIEDNAGDW